MTNDITNTVKTACVAAAARLLAAITPERRSICLMRARRVFDTADQFPRAQFLSVEDKAGFVVWSSIGTPFKTDAVQRFIDGVVSEAKLLSSEVAGEKKAA